MKTLAALGAGLFVLLGVAAPRRPVGQDPQAAVTAAGVRRAVATYLADVGAAAGRAAVAELEAMIERDYAAVHAVWAAAAGDPAAQRARSCLRSLLQLDAVAAAAAVVHGRLARVERIQGGVVDYHWLVAHLADFEVLRADAAIAADLRRGDLPVLRGTSRDHWLAAQLEQNLARVDGARVWLLAPARRLAPVTAGATAAAAAGAGGLELREWIALPAGALAAVRAALR